MGADPTPDPKSARECSWLERLDRQHALLTQLRVSESELVAPGQAVIFQTQLGRTPPQLPTKAILKKTAGTLSILTLLPVVQIGNIRTLWPLTWRRD